MLRWAGMVCVVAGVVGAGCGKSQEASSARGADRVSQSQRESRSQAEGYRPVHESERRPTSPPPGGRAEEQAPSENPAADPNAEEDPAIAKLTPANATETAPDTFSVVLDTTKGEIRIDVTRAWSPNGADRFYNLVRLGYYDDTAFFRVMEGFMAQVGMHGNPTVTARFQAAPISDDPVVESNRPGYVTFAKTRLPNSRTAQFFINTVNNANLDRMGFAPFGVTRDLDVVRSLFSGYGEPPTGPNQARIAQEGNDYLRREFPNLDYIRSATIVEE